MAIKVSFIQGRPRPRDERTGRFVRWDRAWKSSTFRETFKDAFTSIFKAQAEEQKRIIFQAKKETRALTKELVRVRREAETGKKIVKAGEKISRKEIKKKVFKPKSPYYKPGDVLDEFLESFNIDEFEFGVPYPDTFGLTRLQISKKFGPKSTARLSYINDFKNMDPRTKWLFNSQTPDSQYRTRPKRVVVWYLLYMPEREVYNIVPWTVNNPDKLSLSRVLKNLNEHFIESAKRYFILKAENEGTAPLEPMDIIFITPYEKYRVNKPE